MLIQNLAASHISALFCTNYNKLKMWILAKIIKAIIHALYSYLLTTYFEYDGSCTPLVSDQGCYCCSLDTGSKASFLDNTSSSENTTTKMTEFSALHLYFLKRTHCRKAKLLVFFTSVQQKTATTLTSGVQLLSYLSWLPSLNQA